MGLRGLRLFLTFTVVLAFAGSIGGVYSYNRPPMRKALVARHLDEKDGIDEYAPQQVHISTVGQDKMRISWITQASTEPIVLFTETAGLYQNASLGTSSSYKYMTYKSDNIHEAVIGPLKPDTVYFYICGKNSSKEYTLRTPPAQLPIRFAVVGDLGQTNWTNLTLQHIAKSNYDMLLLPGNLAYADFLQYLWDSFGKLVEPLASKRPWMVTQGNHEIEKFPLLHKEKFTAYNARWRMPFEESGSNSNLYYSFNVAGVHVIMLGSYTDFDNTSAQYQWLQADMGKINRKITPWIVAVVHAPWYNSNFAHIEEKEEVDMKESMEDLLYKARVDVVFAGHVDAYERFTHVYKDNPDICAPVYINVGTGGGNSEGLSFTFQEPQPGTSVFRETSFGHGEFAVVNSTHAHWTWRRNDDDQAIVRDMVWLISRSSDSSCSSQV
ncbi:probable purple acid phosphatase 20 [Quercus suber]|uniref:probable purple acid phosphatase 20 n=1 Tax=Quercus suber TaxID=58331 RepID=UPI000CE26481|nr:probable purple acid phosphatase 20 [Quercus suber]POE64346.1 putative purple acid phosphatase 20 [Quercus suber]